MSLFWGIPYVPLSISSGVPGSGASQILMESGVLTKGSLDAFLSGKRYNQARRMHVLLATAMKSNQLDLFLQLDEINDTYVH